MRYPSPLRYPGGKRSIARFIKLLVVANELEGGDYVEPYAGGAAAALSLLYGGYVRHIHLNDLNPQLFAFWQSVLNETEELSRLIKDTPVRVDTWQQQKEIYDAHEAYSTLQVGFAFFFLNRTNRSGILNGGVIGGMEQQGKYKIDARYNKDGLIERIKLVAQKRSAIHIYNKRASEFIEEDVVQLPHRTLVYLDPPYYVKGGDLYDNYYSHADHEIIRRLIARRLRAKKWLVSYDNVPEIQALYRYYRCKQYSLRYSANERVAGSEAMFFSSNMVVPEVSSPAYIDKQQFQRLLEQIQPAQTRMMFQ
jgi:DNA adenine methylase